MHACVYLEAIIIKEQIIILSAENSEGGRGVMVIVEENWHGDTGSYPGRDWLHFTWHKCPWERYESNYSPSSYV